MGKGRTLEPYRKTLITVVAAFMLISACSLPTIIRDPLTPEEHIVLGMSYEKNGELQSALEQYQYAKKKEPLGYLYMGNIYFQLNEYGLAEQSYKKAISLTKEPAAMNNLAWLYLTQGIKLNEAEKLAKSAVSHKPDSVDFRDTLMQILEKQRLK